MPDKTEQLGFTALEVIQTKSWMLTVTITDVFGLSQSKKSAL
ncbi:hypothetical protein N473_01160 [Pseudoalteromonas luteoviolacea CPMOR-1]|uniref:Uncharacterized protein n=1 Tax=Pseudoalteromonas luteoviolacea CPMOR-1 TaxID=1365248 RepID=A0A161YSQ0_9GAMM|nr:hypothetical protein N473_01160 [Pseudoalteromonas luteoviolacea CPMOR-1]